MHFPKHRGLECFLPCPRGGARSRQMGQRSLFSDDTIVKPEQARRSLRERLTVCLRLYTVRRDFLKGGKTKKDSCNMREEK